jgi:DNA-binding response OmpR family regulator
LPRILIVSEDSNEAAKLHSELDRNGFVCSIISRRNGVIETLTEQVPDLVLVETDGDLTKIGDLSRSIKQEKPLPIIALVNRETIGNVNGSLDLIDDFIAKPYDLRELMLRTKRLLHKTDNSCSAEVIKCGDLVIDSSKCEVSVGGNPVMLTFREYELLKFLASNRGRVFTREALLNRVWGYDYYGGDRTVDVHIRRLRSKIEDASHTFIETVRNIGYKFNKDS